MSVEAWAGLSSVVIVFAFAVWAYRRAQGRKK